MHTETPFKWRHYQGDVILLCVRWYLRYSLSYRDLEEMMAERGMQVDHSTIARWVLAYAQELETRVKSHLKATNDSWRVDETYIKIKGEWAYLYRAIDSAGNTLEFRLSRTRDAAAAVAFFRTVLAAPHTTHPRVINVDKNAAYPTAFAALQQDHTLSENCQLRQVRYLNNGVEQDHRFIKRRLRPGSGFFSFACAEKTVAGYEVMNMFRKGQIEGIAKGDMRAEVDFIHQLFGLAA